MPCSKQPRPSADPPPRPATAGRLGGRRGAAGVDAGRVPELGHGSFRRGTACRGACPGDCHRAGPGRFLGHSAGATPRPLLRTSCAILIPAAAAAPAQLYEAVAAAFPNGTLAQFNFANDTTQMFYYQLQGGKGGGAVWASQALASIAGLVDNVTNFRAFTARGTAHCTINAAVRDAAPRLPSAKRGRRGPRATADCAAPLNPAEHPSVALAVVLRATGACVGRRPAHPRLLGGAAREGGHPLS